MANLPTPPFMDGTPSELNELENGDIEVILDPDLEPDTSEESVETFDTNLADYMSEEELAEVSDLIMSGFDADKASRKDWEDQIKYGLKLLGLRVEEGSQPFQGACNATHPLIIESAVKYQSKAIQELFPAVGPVKTTIIGQETPEKLAQSKRVKDYMNWQLTEQMSEYYDDTERLLFSQAIIGSAIRKTYYNFLLGRPVSEHIPIDKFHIANEETNLEFARRYGQILEYSEGRFKSLVSRGIYRDVPTITPVNPEVGDIQDEVDKMSGFERSNESQVYELYECHTYLSLDPAIEPMQDEFDAELPYIVTLDLTNGAVLSIRRNWDSEDVYKRKLEWFSHRKFVPGFGFYGLGLIHLVGNSTATATAAIRSLVDAGMFANLPGGFKAKGIRIAGVSGPIEPGEWREVECTGMDLQKAIIPLPYKEPSQTLMGLLKFMDERGQRFADTTEQVLAESQNVGPVGTTLALLEAAAKFFAATHKRNHKAQRDEFRILARINRDHMDAPYSSQINGLDVSASAMDFDGKIDIVPISDPNIPSAAHRLSIAQAKMEVAQRNPQLHDMRQIYADFYDAMGVTNIEKILPLPAQAFTGDPASENARLMTGSSVKADPQQDHDSHIAVHQAFLEDKQYVQNQVAQQKVAPTVSAHIMEHMAHKYMRQMEATMGHPVQPGTDPTADAPISQEQAAAGQAILKAAQASDNDQSNQTTPLEAAQIQSLQARDQLAAAEAKAKAELDQSKFQMEAQTKMAELLLKKSAQELETAALMLKAEDSGVKNLLKEREMTLNYDAKKFGEQLDLMAALANKPQE